MEFRSIFGRQVRLRTWKVRVRFAHPTLPSASIDSRSQLHASLYAASMLSSSPKHMTKTHRLLVCFLIVSVGLLNAIHGSA